MRTSQAQAAIYLIASKLWKNQILMAASKSQTFLFTLRKHAAH
jgi:hypothetical protein